MFHQKSIKGTFIITFMLILTACGEVGPSPSFSSNATTSSELNNSSDFYASSSSSISSSSSSQTPIQHTITFKNYDDSVLSTQKVNQGFTAVYSGPTPTKPSTDEYTYTFTGWDKTLTNINSSFSTVAQYSQVLNYIPITTAEELSNIRNNLSGNYRLMNDIDLASVEWQPIGTATSPFSGTLDGKDFTISNLIITETHEYVGLFANNSGTIKNLNIDHVQINVTGSLSSFIYAGTLVALNSGTIENIVSIDGTLNAKSRSGNPGFIGGLVGWITGGTLNNIQNNLDINSDYSTSLGGIVGYSTSNLNFTNLINRGDILSSSEFVGGVLGKSNNTSLFSECGNEGNVTGINYVGGIIGTGRNNYPITINNSYNFGLINGSSYVGGMVGVSFDLNIMESINFGNVSGLQYIGGLVGQVEKGNALITNSINRANIVASGVFSGGFVGLSGASTVITISDSLSLGSIFGGDGVVDGTGGFVGLANNKLFVYSSIFIGKIFLLNQIFPPYYLGGISGLIGGLWDIDNTYYFASFSIGNNVFVDGNDFGAKVTDISTINLEFFITTLGWDTEIWDFTGLDVANGVYPTLKNMPEIPVEE
jgi:hypothetical protein